MSQAGGSRLIVERQINDFLVTMPDHLQTSMIKTIVNRDSKTNKHHLLGLPPEIRNRIYRFVLVETDTIEISATSPPLPGLLSVSREIREETTAIYHSENNFDVVIMDFDAQAVYPLYLLQLKYYVPSTTQRQSGEAAAHGVKYITTDGAPNWPNLLTWCFLIHHGSMRPISYQSTEGDDLELVVVQAMHAALEELYTVPWQRVQAAMRTYRKLLMAWDPHWAL